MFADHVTIEVRAGKGGDGRLSFRHEKYRAMGGPDGGNGGRGGNIVFHVNHNLNTLAAYKRQRRITAPDGQNGGGNRQHGRTGEDTIIMVPEGTQVIDEAGVVLFDLVEDGQEGVVAQGGRGGFGNAHFTSSTRQAPRTTEVGEMGEVKQLTLELKLVADIGLVGLPNAGKSTLLSVISNAKPEIGDYPFTTLTPNLGVTDIDGTTVLVADIPGLIEGASEGKGLGDDFLRHIERTAVLLHLIDAYSEDVGVDYKTIQEELKGYEVDLTAKPQITVLTKIEGIESAIIKKHQAALKKAGVKGLLTISSVAQKGVDELMRAALPLVQAERQRRQDIQEEEALPVINEATQPDLWDVAKTDKGFVVSGRTIEGFARRTAWDNDASVDRLRDIMRKQGIMKALEKAGAEPDAVITIGEYTVPLRES